MVYVRKQENGARADDPEAMRAVVEDAAA